MPVEISVIGGPFSDLINGIYTSTEERLNGKTVYCRLGDASKRLFFAADKWWISSMTAEVKAGEPAGFAHTEAGLPHPMLAKEWHIWSGNSWKQQSMKNSVIVSLCNYYTDPNCVPDMK